MRASHLSVCTVLGLLVISLLLVERVEGAPVELARKQIESAQRCIRECTEAVSECLQSAAEDFQKCLDHYSTDGPDGTPHNITKEEFEICKSFLMLTMLICQHVTPLCSLDCVEDLVIPRTTR